MFRFTIRDVLWLTVVVAVSVGWWVNRRSWSAQLWEERQRIAEKLLRLQAERDAARAASEILRQQSEVGN
jgi:hypothetical protein